MDSIILSSTTNYNGYIANITFYPLTGGTIALGQHQIPYIYSSNYVYGSYDLYFSSWTKTCSTSISPQPVTITANTSVFSLVVNGTAFQVNWGDGSPLENVTNGTLTHNYSSGGVYIISFIPVYLISLGVSNNGVTEISQLPNTVTQLSVQNNSLTSLYLNNLLNLVLLNCNNNNLTTLDITHNSSLNIVDASHNQVSSLNISNQISLTNLDISFNNLTSLNFTNNLYLTNLYCNNNNISTLTFDDTGNSNYSLNILNISHNNLSTLTLCGGLDTLSYLYCQYNSLTVLDYLPYSLSTLDCSYNLLTTIPFTNCSYSVTEFLSTLNCSHNQISLLDITGVPIYQLDATYNQLDSTNINNILVNLQNLANVGGTALLNNQTPPACPTGVGILAEDYLINNNGWTITVDPGCSGALRISFNTSFAYWYIAGSDIFDMSINWGDGSPTEFYSTDYLEISHSFLTSPATATIVFADNTIITQIDLTPNYGDSGAYNGVTNITGLDILTNLQYLSLDGNLFSTFTSTLPNSLLGLGLSSNQLTTFNSTLPSSLTSLGLASNQLTTFNSTLPSSLTSLGLASNQLTTFNSTLPNSITNLNLSNNQLIQNSYNNVLIELSGNGTSNGTVRLNNQTPAICPTGGGVTAKDYLTNTLNWNVVIGIDCYPNIFEILFDTNIDLSFNGNIFGFPLTSTNSIVDYGDGDSQVFVNTAINLGHSYQDYTGIKTIKIALSDPNLFNLVSFIGIPGIIGVNNLNLLSSLNQIQISDGTSLSQSSVNYILTTLSGMSFSNGYIILNNQTTVACPSGNGISAKNYLLGLNNTILTDDCPILTIDLNVTTLLSSSMAVIFTGDSSFDLLIDWNDGSTSAYTGNNININKLYNQIGSYNVTISVTGRTYINHISFGPTNTVTNIGQFDKLTNLNYLNLEGNKLTSVFSLPYLITYLNLQGNKLDNLGIENTINSFTGYGWTTPFIDLRGQQYPGGCLQLYTTTAYNNYVSLTNAGWTIYVDFCPYYPVTLSYNSEVCDTFNTLFTEYYVDANLGVSVGSTLYIDSLGATVAPDGYYTKNNLYPALPDILIVSGGTGEIIEITLCDIGFLGNYNLGGLPALCDDANDYPDFYSKNGVVTIGEKVYINGSPYSQLVLWNTTGLISRNNFYYYQINNGIIGPYAGTCTNI